jgi:large-conductance mechanosensitive channel
MATTDDTKKSTTATTKAKARASVIKTRGAESANGFISFVREQGIVGLAIGLAVGAAAGDTVKKLVEGFITPIVQFIVGSRDGLETATWHLELFGRSADFKWGAFISSLIALLATALVIYWIIHVLKLDRIDKKKE